MINFEEELFKYYGFSEFRTGQKNVIERVLTGKSAAAIFPTGAGKSLCYQLPAQLLPGLTLVVSPLISLMHDQLDFLLKHNVEAAVLDSTLSREDYQLVLSKAVSGTLKVLMISVERFKNERFRSYLVRMNISLLVVDEAHCISEWGHNFRPEYLKLPGYIKEFSIPQVLLLTATATTEVAEDICSKINILPENLVRTGFYRKNLFLQLTPVENLSKKELLIKRLQERGPEPTIVYVTLQKTAQEVADALYNAGIKSKAYHAGMKSENRALVQQAFMSGEVDCIVATIAFGMGVDKSDIRAVYHYDLPKSIENYSQEIGRAGRDGAASHCEVLANGDGITVLENFVYGDTPTLDGIKKLLDNLKQSDDMWEIKPLSLSGEVNIRLLPLKTLMVYLEITGYITSSFSYFADYQFKTDLSSTEVLSGFNQDRQVFLKELFSFCQKKRTWTTVDIDGFVQSTGNQRSRTIAALEYLDSQNLIELSAKQAVEVYKKTGKDFDIETLSLSLLDLFKNKESSEIARINNMIKLFESDTCISTKLAAYFGENMSGVECGHCSVCCSNPVLMSRTELAPLTSQIVEQKLVTFINKAGSSASKESCAGFLCGITTPLLTKLKSRGIPGFGSLESYAYSDVLRSITLN